MPVGIYKIDNGKFINISSKLGLEKSNGLYNTLEVVINKDSFPDIIIGNHGLNSFFKASERHPLTMYVNDFDKFKKILYLKHFLTPKNLKYFHFINHTLLLVGIIMIIFL